MHEAIYTLRAMRRLRPDPVSDADLAALVDAATQAPSAANAQHWAFVVVTDPEQRRRLGALYREVGRAAIGGALESGRLDEERTRVYRNALFLVEHMGEAPALVVAALRGPQPEDPVRAAPWYGSIFPAIQNLMLAARARGLGTCLTTLHKAREAEVRRILGMPDAWETVALLPVGHPRGRFGALRRRPSREALHWDRWGGRRGPDPG